MKTCPCCTASRITNGHSIQYDSLPCQWCAARLIRDIGKLPIVQTEATARRRVVLADALAYGQNEAVIRALVKNGPWLEPLPEKRGQSK